MKLDWRNVKNEVKALKLQRDEKQTLSYSFITLKKLMKLEVSGGHINSLYKVLCKVLFSQTSTFHYCQKEKEPQGALITLIKEN